ASRGDDYPRRATALKDAAAKVEPTTVVQRGDVDLSQTSYAWARLVDQLDWYERKSGTPQPRAPRAG
ncbi:MAG: hypothetical protein ACJ76Q_06805, partial [Solirubrobacteraceae bacterium]